MSLDNDVDLLRRAPEFRSFEADALRLLAFAAGRAEWAPGEMAFRSGDPAEGAIVVLDGELKLYQPDENAAGLARRKGDVIDEMAMYVETERLLDGAAVRPTSALLVSRAMIRRVLSEFPKSAMAVREDISRRLDELSTELAGIGQKLADMDDRR